MRSVQKEGKYVYVYIYTEVITRLGGSGDAEPDPYLHPCDATDPRSGEGRDLFPQSLSNAALPTG